MERVTSSLRPRPLIIHSIRLCVHFLFSLSLLLRREQWPMFSTYSCWQLLVNQTKALSKDHATLSEIYTTHLVARLQTVIEDVQRIYKKCREIGYETHEEILRVLQELHTTMKTYHSYQTECKAAEAKLRTAETQRMKLQQTIPKEKLDRSKKYRLIEKEMLKVCMIGMCWRSSPTISLY